MQFFVGLHQPSDARHFRSVFLSINRLRGKKGRRSAFGAPAAQLAFPGAAPRALDWILDSGAFTELRDHHDYRTSPEVYAAEIMRWAAVGNLLAAVSQDWMCEPFILRRTGLTVLEHQTRTIDRYDRTLAALPAGAPYLMPVLQGFEPGEYVAHLAAYGARLAPGAWVGVGSVCKRNGTPDQVLAVLRAILAVRPDLRLHGFGLKLTSLAHPDVRACLHTADSMAWSLSARKKGRNQNDWREARRFVRAIDRVCRPKGGSSTPPPRPRKTAAAAARAAPI